MKERCKKVLMCLAAVLMTLLISAVGVQAATVKTVQWSDEPAVKVGGAWYRSVFNYNEETGESGITIDRSTVSATTGFKPIISGKDLGGGFAVDGKKVYFLQKNVLKAYAIKTGKITTVKKLKSGNDVYYNFNGYYNKKIWLLGRVEKCGVQTLLSLNPKTGKVKTEKKKFLCFNPAAPTRYLVISEGRTKLSTKTGATYKLKVYDKKTGKTKTICKKARPWWWASGGGYDTMSKYTIYGEYNKKKKIWEIKEYKFSKKKTYVLKKLKKGEQLYSLLYWGNGVRYGLKTDPLTGVWDDSRIVKAK